jgi:hypothetical protein
VTEAEEHLHQLLALASEDVPREAGGHEGLLRGVLTRRARARRARRRLLTSAATTGVLTAALVILMSAATARLPGTSVTRHPTSPEAALTAVTLAAAETAVQTYQVQATFTYTGPRGVSISPSRVTLTGEFDPASGLGEVSGPRDIRWTGGYAYVYVGHNPAFAAKPWIRVDESAVRVLSSRRLGLGDLVAGRIGPQGLLEWLRSASQVTAVGPAAGPGWTGTRYAVRARTTVGYYAGETDTGTVDVDRQGLVRQLDLTQVSKVGADEFGTTVRLAFDDFGLPVAVAAPPLSQTYTGVKALSFAGWSFAATTSSPGPAR